MNQSLNSPPFPPLEWDDYCWAGSIILPAWKGFQSRSGAYGSQSSVTASDGTTYLNVVTPNDEPVPPSPEQASAYRHLVEHQESIRDAILQSIFAEYAEWQDQYGYDEEEAQKYMPDLERPDQLKSLVGLSTVRIFGAAKGDTAYIGFGFGCTWDDEHGLGAMTHAERVVEVGGADTAILEWIADKDAESS